MIEISSQDNRNLILGIDVGGSGIKGSVVDIDTGELVLKRRRIPTPQPASPQAISETFTAITKHFDWEGPIGCGFPAVIQHGIVKTAANISLDWIGQNAVELFQEATGCPVRVLNDADAAGTAEIHFGAGRNYRGLVLMLTVGTGIGTALFIDGHLVPNTELGHIIMQQGIEAEHYASDQIRKELDSWPEWAQRFDEYLLEMERLLTPDLIIIGGGTSKKFHLFEHLITAKTPIVPAQLLNQAGIVGAAMAAKRLLHETGPKV